MNFEISDESKKALLGLARQTVDNRLSGKSGVELYDLPDDLGFNGGCFVTLHKRGMLRGCIGNFRDDINIGKNVIEMAASAAFSDPRFSAVSAEEMKDIDFEISVLSPMIPVEDVEEIQVGRDGLYVVMGFNSGVLLPQVATENRWDRNTFLGQVCKKAGLSNETWKNGKVKIYRFEALVFGEK